MIAVGLDLLLEGFVELSLRGRPGDLAKLRIGGVQLELVAIHVIARRDREIHLELTITGQLHVDLEGLLGIEELVGARRSGEQG